jgi:hypothetical protein
MTLQEDFQPFQTYNHCKDKYSLLGTTPGLDHDEEGSQRTRLDCTLFFLFVRPQCDSTLRIQGRPTTAHVG